MQGYELTKIMVEEIRKVAGEGDDVAVTRNQVIDAVLTAVHRYAVGAVEVMTELIKREYAAVGVDVQVNTGAPDNAVMDR